MPGDSGGVADGHEGGGELVNGTLQSPDTRYFLLMHDLYV